MSSGLRAQSAATSASASASALRYPRSALRPPPSALRLRLRLSHCTHSLTPPPNISLPPIPGIAGALVPLVDVITTDLLTMYSILSTISVTTLVTLLALPNPEDDNVRRHLPPKVLKSSSGSRAVDPRIQKYFVTEFLIGNMVFWLIGGKVLCSSYIEDYVTQSGVIASSKKEYALLVVWLYIALGRFGGLSDQIRINRMGPIGIHTLYTHLTVWVICGFFGGLVMWIWMSSCKPTERHHRHCN